MSPCPDDARGLPLKLLRPDYSDLTIGRSEAGWSELIAADIEGAVEHAKDVDVAVILDHVGDAVVLGKQDADLAW